MSNPQIYSCWVTLWQRSFQQFPSRELASSVGTNFVPEIIGRPGFPCLCTREIERFMEAFLGCALVFSRYRCFCLDSEQMGSPQQYVARGILDSCQTRVVQNQVQHSIRIKRRQVNPLRTTFSGNDKGNPPKKSFYEHTMSKCVHATLFLYSNNPNPFSNYTI